MRLVEVHHPGRGRSPLGLRGRRMSSAPATPFRRRVLQRVCGVDQQQDRGSHNRTAPTNTRIASTGPDGRPPPRCRAVGRRRLQVLHLAGSAAAPLVIPLPACWRRSGAGSSGPGMRPSHEGTKRRGDPWSPDLCRGLPRPPGTRLASSYGLDDRHTDGNSGGDQHQGAPSQVGRVLELLT